MPLAPDKRARIEKAIQQSLKLLDATPMDAHPRVIESESERLAQVLNDEGIDPELAAKMLEKMKEISLDKHELKKEERMLEAIQRAERSMFSRGFARSALDQGLLPRGEESLQHETGLLTGALKRVPDPSAGPLSIPTRRAVTQAQANEVGAAMEIEGELWPHEPQLPIVAQVPEEESRHGAFAAEHSALRIYADEEQHEAIVVKAISKLAGLTAQRAGFVIDRDVLEDAEQKMSEHNSPTDSTLSLATKPQNIEVSRELAERVASKMGTDLAGLKKIWQQDFDDLCNWSRALAKQWTAPPIEHCVSATNVEAWAMAVIHFTVANADCPWTKAGNAEEQYTVWTGISETVPEFDRVRSRAATFYSKFFETSTSAFHAFGIAWRDSAYARLEIGHKLAASLCLTDTEGVDVTAPWPACSVVVPDGLFPATNAHGTQVARLWCLGTEVVFAVMSDGRIVTSGDELSLTKSASGGATEFQTVLDNFVRGAFLALANPEEFKKQKTSSSSSSKKNNRSGPPDLSQARYMLSAPVSIDFRDMLHEHLTGKHKGGGAPKVQFLVRGHWRQQAHGPKRSLRSPKWIKPFWKGPEEARVLLRAHKIKENDGEESG